MPEWNNGIAKITLPTPFGVGDVHVYMVKGDRLTLVDAGMKTEAAWEAFQYQLKQLRLKPADIEQVILTHHHPDHVGLLDFLSPQLEVYGHPANERWLNKTPTFMNEWKTFFTNIFAKCGVSEHTEALLRSMKRTLDFACQQRSISGTIIDGDTPPGMNGWTVVETLGHAQSHIVLYREKDRVMIGGDQLLDKTLSNPLLEPPLSGETERPKSQLQYNESMRKLLDYPISTLYPGHGANIENVPEVIDYWLSRQHKRALKVREMLKDTPLTVYEICQRLFPSAYKKELSLTVSVAVGQIDYLRSLDALTVIQEENKPLRFLAK